MDTLQKILDLIQKHHQSDAEFEKENGLKPKTVDSWKRGNSKGYLKILPQLSHKYNVSTDYLLGNESNIKVYDEHDNIVVLDDETREIIDSLRTNPEMKILFSVTKKATKEDIIQAVKIIEALKGE